MISLTIDGKTVEVPAGTTVLRAAEAVGITIPTLCDHPALPPYGGCRLCVVEVQGFRTPIASCTLPVSPGMVVNTDTEKLRSIRKFVLSMLFSERNHFCPFCQKTGGDCELQNAAYGEDMTHWPIMPNWSTFPVDASHPYFIFDHNRCILCRRCVRACAEMAGNYTLGMENRGARTLVVADYGLPMGESTCIRCGSCVQVCPTGALIERNSAYQGLEKDAQIVESICTACSVGCGIHLLVRDNRIIRVLGDWDAPVNTGVLCVLGRYQTLEDNRTRITEPMIRKNGELVPATWEEALNAVSQKLQTSSGNVAALVSSRLPAEDLFAFKQLFGEKLQNKTVASIEENLTSADLSDEKLYGNLDDLKNSDCVLVIGADLVKSHQVAGFFVKRNRIKGVTIIVVDPNENETAAIAQYALRLKAGSDAALMRSLVSSLESLGFSASAIPILKGSQPTSASLAQGAEATGIPAETLVAVSRELGLAKAPVIVFGKGVTGARDGALQSLEELARAAGALLINPMGKANSHAAHAYDLDHTFTPADSALVYLALGDDFPTPRLEKVILKNSNPTDNHKAYLVVQASHSSPITESADVVLPVEMWAEHEGHYLNLEGRLQKASRVLSPSASVRSNRMVFQAIAKELNVTIGENWREALALVPNHAEG
jgi:formate dehydrogenase major subunit